MADYFRDFVDPIKIIFNRLQQQKDNGVVINGKDGLKTGNVIPPFYPNLPEYPCKLLRDANNKVTEIQYGESSKGYIWRQLIHRGPDGKVDYIKQENPDGSFSIVLHRDTNGRVDLVKLD